MIGMTYSVANYEEYKEIGDANLFEEVIDDMMLEKYSDDKELTEYIISLSREDKRMAILSLLDGDNNLWVKLKSMISGNKLTKLDQIKDVVTMLRDYVKVGEVEKKKFGEVMTPLELVKEMLATLPEDVWSNPDLKWLDPANGTGPYPIMVIYKLMKGLESWETDSDKRYKHIVENMIYTCELQSRNIFLWLCAVDPKDEYITNTYWGSFLEEGFDYHMKDVWCVDKFDIVMGNPPYNTGTSGGNGSRDLWDKFVYKSINELSENGHLVFVHPSKWRSPEHKCLESFKKYNLKFLEIHSKQDGKKVFGAITRYDFYCLQKSNYTGITKIIDQLGVSNNIDIMEWDWIPNYNFDLISKIITKEDGLDVIYSRGMYGNDKKWMSIEKTEENNFPCVYGMYKDYTCSYRYSSENKGHFGVPKVILGLGEKIYPLIDTNGGYGIMNNAFALPISSSDEGDCIKKAIETDEFKEIIKSTKWSNFQVNWKMFKSFKKDFWREFI